MRLRVPELLAEHGLTPHQLHLRSGGRISKATAYRLAAGTFKEVRAPVLDALCDIFGIADPGPLLARDDHARPPRQAARKRRA